MIDFVSVLKKAVEMGASDIHICVGSPPMVRVSGTVLPMPDYAVVTADESQNMIYSILYENQRKDFEQQWELDCSFSITDFARFRVNVLRQKNGIEAVLRVISSKIPSAQELELSETITGLADLPRGLVLVTGPTGSGKSTTLACLIDLINEKYRKHIITIEDPIEFVYENKNCIIRQREIGSHTHSFADALKRCLRQDPDIIMIGEMRDLETISIALTMAETGHLAFGTLHTTDAPQTIERIIDVFPSYQQQQVRTQMAGVLRAVVSQTLLPRMTGKGLVAARETMIVTPAIANLIREGKTHMVYNAIETGSKFGMISMDKHLEKLARERVVRVEDAIAKAHNPEALTLAIGRLGGMC